METPLDINKQYEDHILRCKGVVELNIDPADREKVSAFANKMTDAKLKEDGYKYDRTSIYTRFETGMTCEATLERYLGVSFVNWEIGDSIDYNYADMSKLGINMGIKSVRKGNFPLIHKRERVPQIIMIKGEDSVLLLGVASADFMEKHQDDKLIRDPSVLNKGKKTALSSFDGLLQFRTMEDLRKIDNKLAFESF